VSKIENQVNQDAEKPAPESVEQTDEGKDDGEFKLTVRKLEMPVRPRGVLADG
jgi:hypothetical protein